MMKHHVTLLMNTFVTHDVRRLIITRPDDFDFAPGEGVELAIDTPEWRDKARPFTPTSLVTDRVVEFTIKVYPQHKGMTQELQYLRPGARLLMSEPFGTINYKGPGVFIAGGAGITPFIAIMRELVEQKDMTQQHMIVSNRTPSDIIYEKELRDAFDTRLQLICTAGDFPGYTHSRINMAFLAKNINDFEQNFYVCGPPGFMEAVTEALQSLGAKSQQLVFEQ